MSEPVRLTIKLTPKASRNEIKGWAQTPDGKSLLKISVTATPEKGMANAALIQLLAKRLNMPKRAFNIIRGDTERIKIIEIQNISYDQFLKKIL